MSATDQKEFFFISEKESPHCYKIQKRYPIEFEDAWNNIVLGRKIDEHIESSIDEILIDIFFEKIAEATIKDGVAEKSDSSPSGLKPLRSFLRYDNLPKIEYVKLVKARVNSLSSVAEKHGVEEFSGCQIATDTIPLEVAKKVRDLLREGQNSLLSCRESNATEESAQVKIAMLMQICKVEK